MEKKEELMRLAFDTISNFIIVDEVGTIIYLNELYADMLGIDQKNALGKPVTKVVPGTEMMEILQTGRRDIGQIMSFHDNKKEKEIRLICNRLPLFRDGKVVGAVAMTMAEDLGDVRHLYSELEKLRIENANYKKKLDSLSENPISRIIGNSPPMLRLKQSISSFADSNLTILITGETGVGKEVFANAIHHLSNRRTNAFVKINCAAIPRELLESELFGYETGAFTGAKKGGKPGKFELADGGTLLLDEIGEMPPDLQAKLLRVLQEKEVERIGGSRPVKINVRVICSTNVNIREMVRQGKLREDLYYRINAVEIKIPPLRERLSDIPALCNYFIRKNNEENGFQTEGISEEVMSLLLQYGWPGNVRELQHVMERLCFLQQQGIIALKHCDFLRRRISDYIADEYPDYSVPERANQPAEMQVSYSYTSRVSNDDTNKIHRPASAETENSVGERTQKPARYDTLDLHSRRSAGEQETIRLALIESGYNKSKAAEILGISRSMLYNKLRKYKIEH